MTSGLPDAVARVSAALEGAQFALVFGSFGTPSFGPESDLDVKLDPQVVRGIAADHLGDLEEFANEVLRKTTASG
jgi:predicted nucleotidyltransferase